MTNRKHSNKPENCKTVRELAELHAFLETMVSECESGNEKSVLVINRFFERKYQRLKPHIPEELALEYDRCRSSCVQRFVPLGKLKPENYLEDAKKRRDFIRDYESRHQLRAPNAC